MSLFRRRPHVLKSRSDSYQRHERNSSEPGVGMSVRLRTDNYSSNRYSWPSNKCQKSCPARLEAGFKEPGSYKHEGPHALENPGEWFVRGLLCTQLLCFNIREKTRCDES